MPRLDGSRPPSCDRGTADRSAAGGRCNTSMDQVALGNSRDLARDRYRLRVGRLRCTARRRITLPFCVLSSRRSGTAPNREPLHTRREVHLSAVGGQLEGASDTRSTLLRELGARRSGADASRGCGLRTRTCDPALSPGSSSPGHLMVTHRVRTASEQRGTYVRWVEELHVRRVAQPYGALLPR